MKRSLLGSLPLSFTLLAVQTVEAAPSEAVVIVQPSEATCIDVSALTVALTAAGEYYPSVVSEQVTAEPPQTPLFRFSGTAESLRIRGWGLSPRSAGDLAPLGSPDSVADLDTTLSGHSCQAIGAAVAATVSGALQQSAAERRQAKADGGADAAEVVRLQLLDANSQLQGDPPLAASVEGQAQGLALIVSDYQGLCRRGTSFDPNKPDEFRLGAPVAQLGDEVRACLRLKEANDAGEGAAVRTATELPPEREVDGIFHLPAHAGAAVAGLGVVVSAVAVSGTDESAALLFGALPMVAGGALSYAVPERMRQPAILGGYWLGMAGASLASAARDDDAKSWLVGGAIAGGALTSASLAILTGFRRGDEPSLPAWAVALPSTVGATVAVGSLLVGTDGARSVPLAGIGALAALIPHAWLFYRLEGGSADRAPRIGAVASGSTAGLTVSGEF